MKFSRIKIFIVVSFSISQLHAQQFINKAVIEYEVKANFRKTLRNNDMWDEMLKNYASVFKTGYYTFTFANDKSVYKFSHWDAGLKLPDFMKKSDEDNVWYFNFATGKFNMQKNVDGSNLNIEDSIPQLQWRLTNENRVIAGFNCRKAVAVIFDSVYVFAFYTDEIMISGGPCSISGLPGMILGVTIPRLFTSWIATKVMLNNVDENAIKPVAAKKNYTMKILKTLIDERTKDWYDEGENAEEEKQQKNRFIWNILL